MKTRHYRKLVSENTFWVLLGFINLFSAFLYFWRSAKRVLIFVDIYLIENSVSVTVGSVTDPKSSVVPGSFKVYSKTGHSCLFLGECIVRRMAVVEYQYPKERGHQRPLPVDSRRTWSNKQQLQFLEKPHDL